jgi:hypothetical protein
MHLNNINFQSDENFHLSSHQVCSKELEIIEKITYEIFPELQTFLFNAIYTACEKSPLCHLVDFLCTTYLDQNFKICVKSKI